MFDNVETARNFVGDSGDEPQRLADQMSRSLARLRPHRQSGDRRRCPTGRRTTPSRRATMVFDLESRVVDDPYSGVRKVLQG